MKLALAVVAVGGVAFADAKIDKPPRACRGEMSWRSLAGFQLQAPFPTAGTLGEPVGSKDDLSVTFTTGDYFLAMRIHVAVKEDVVDYERAKARIEARAKAANTAVKWTGAAKTSDGYVLVYRETTDPHDSKTGTQYTADVLRTFGDKKVLCANSSFVGEDASACAQYICEQLEPQ